MLRVKSNFKDLGISAGSRLGLKKTDGLKTGNNCESQANPKRIGVEYLKSSSSGGKEVISESSLGGVLLWEEESEDGKLGKSAVHDLNLTVTDEFLWEALAARPAGSKKPTGGRSPIRPVGFTLSFPKEMFFATPLAGASLTARVAERALPLLATGAGAKAAAPAMRVEITASFMVVV